MSFNIVNILNALYNWEKATDVKLSGYIKKEIAEISGSTPVEINALLMDHK